MTTIKNLSIITLLLSLAACKYKKETDLVNVCNASNAKYSTDVAPIMASYCNGCHSGASPSSGILTDNYNNLKSIALGGSLYGSMNHATGYSPMPKGASKLDDCSLAKIKNWVDAGAPQN
jgi:hypothetical protein